MAAYIVDSVRNPFKGKSFFLVESSAEISTVPYLPSSTSRTLDLYRLEDCRNVNRYYNTRRAI